MNRITELENSILKHKRLYYAGTPEISDQEFDGLEAELARLKPDSFVLKMVGIQDFKADFKHAFPMLSNQKCLTDEELYKWLKSMYRQGYREFSASEKMDGMSCSLHYKEGRLVRAVSRGDGLMGTDITAKVSIFVPRILNVDFSGEIRGELVMSFASFDKLNAMSPEPFTHPRNAVVGVINDDSLNEDRLNLVDFKVFKIINKSLEDTTNPWFGDIQTIAADLDIAAELGFSPVEHYEFVLGSEDVAADVDSILRYFESVQEKDYPKDGVVIRVNNNYEFEDLGYTSHHPRGATAWKFKANEVSVTIKDIEWSVGTTDISPVAIFDSVVLDGALISKASLKSVKNMVDLGIVKGSRVIIRRSGGVIPAVLRLAE